LDGYRAPSALCGLARGLDGVGNIANDQCIVVRRRSNRRRDDRRACRRPRSDPGCRFLAGVVSADQDLGRVAHPLQLPSGRL